MQWLAAARDTPARRPVADRGGRRSLENRAAEQAGGPRSPSCPDCPPAGPPSLQCREAGEGSGLAAPSLPRVRRAQRRNDPGSGELDADVRRALAPAAERLKPGLAATIERRRSPTCRRALAGRLARGASIHADYFPDNVFFRRRPLRGNHRLLLRVPGMRWPMIIGVALNAWCFEADGSFNVTAARAFVDGYRAHAERLGARGTRSALPVLSPRRRPALLSHPPERLGRDAAPAHWSGSQGPAWNMSAS